MKRVGIVGVGLLGTAVASRLLEGGFTVVGYDTRPEATAALTAQGLVAARSLAEAVAETEAVFTVLPTPEAVEAVFRAPSGLLDAAAPGTVILQMSTISPALTRHLGAEAVEAGLGFLDTPVSGTSAMVARGDCVIFVGGAPEALEACRPLLAAIGRGVLHLGEVGQASLAKLATNLIVGLNTAALAEALVLGVKGGLDPALLLGVFRQTAAASRMADVRGPLMVEHRFEPQMKLELFVKDFNLMLAEGQRLGVALPLTGLTRELASAAAAGGHAGDDLATLVTVYERLAGLGE